MIGYISRSCDSEKAAWVADYVSKSGDLWKEKFDGLCKQFKTDSGIEFPKKEILMHYTSKSCDLLKARMGAILTAYISRSCDLPKKEILVAYISSFKIVLDRIFSRACEALYRVGGLKKGVLSQQT